MNKHVLFVVLASSLLSTGVEVKANEDLKNLLRVGSGIVAAGLSLYLIDDMQNDFKKPATKKYILFVSDKDQGIKSVSDKDQGIKFVSDKDQGIKSVSDKDQGIKEKLYTKAEGYKPRSKGMTISRGVGLLCLIPAIAVGLTGDLDFGKRSLATAFAAFSTVGITNCVVPHGKRTFWVIASMFAQYQAWKILLNYKGFLTLDIVK